MKRVILPSANRKDLRDVPDVVRNEMEFFFVERIQEVLEQAIPEAADRVQLMHA